MKQTQHTHHNVSTPNPTRPRPTSAIVVGAGMAGLVAARVLSDHVERVTILERDALPRAVMNRRGVPQGRHAHVLLRAGQQLLERWFPGLRADLVDRGAVEFDSGDLVWHQAGGQRVRTQGLTALSMTRPLLECAVRERLLAQRRNVRLIEGTGVDRPLVEDGHVVGVLVDRVEQRADLVVDCTGRNTRSFDQLAEAGYPEPDISSINIEMAYGTRVIPRRCRDLDGAAAVVIDDPRRGHRMATMVPVEDDRWIITAAGFHGDVPPTDSRGFADFARSLPFTPIAEVLDRAGPGPVMTHRLATSQRRHVEHLERTAPGFIVLGDAICSFNPVYGQGMTSAAIQADALERCLRRHSVTSPALPRQFYRRAARVVDVPWRIAAGADFADPRTTGSVPAGTHLANRYLDRVALACHTSPSVNRRVTDVQHLLARPTSLLRPSVIVRVCIASRRSQARRRPSRSADVSRRATAPRSNSIQTTPELIRATQSRWPR